LSRLTRLDADIEARREYVRRYRAALRDVDGIELQFDDEAVERGSHFAFAVLCADRAARDALRTDLLGRGIQTTWYPALPDLTAYHGLGAVPVSEEVAGRHLALPLSATLGDGDQAIVVESLRAALAQ
jgi:dTDP-4-amino-4,6-dideoxygalactose transaminase